MKQRPDPPEWKGKWYSICSHHQEYDSACDLCNIGEWISDELNTLERWLHDRNPKLWQEWASRLNLVSGKPQETAMRFNVRLVFNDWQDQNFNSVYQTEEGEELSKRNFHSGSTWEGVVEMTENEMRELKLAMAKGYRPIFEMCSNSQGE